MLSTCDRDNSLRSDHRFRENGHNKNPQSAFVPRGRNANHGGKARHCAAAVIDKFPACTRYHPEIRPRTNTSSEALRENPAIVQDRPSIWAEVEKAQAQDGCPSAWRARRRD